MKKLAIGILAHVDAGKTSLSESMLFLSGKIRRMGRVDNRDAYLDTNELERLRGITIFSKQAVFQLEDTEVTLLDTPGHIDFSAEMERTLQILDYAILVISGADGIQGHTKTLWRLLSHYTLPTFIFVNKMDQQGTDALSLMNQLQAEFGEGCIHFNDGLSSSVHEALAMMNESVMETYLEEGEVPMGAIQKLIKDRIVFPVFFGSALKQQGIEAFMAGLNAFTIDSVYPESFGAKIFKISRDAQGNRLTHMKITGGSLSVRESIRQESWEEKVTQIRVYSGDKFEAPVRVDAGMVCAVTGLTKTQAGMGLGYEETTFTPQLEPVLSYKLILPEGMEARVLLPKLRQLVEEEPELQLVWNETHKELTVQIMGEVQLEILQAIILERFEVAVSFGEGQIVYKETIEDVCEGVGHFEPLGHYAEVHLLLEPGPLGSGLKWRLDCREDILDKSWQKLILSHLKEKTHLGVLTGSPITDLCVTVVSGRAHKRHTGGGDFREATYRAIRQGLKQANSILLEPYYQYRLDLPQLLVGRAMADIDLMKGTCQIETAEGERVRLTGSAPVATMRNYHKEVIAYSRGHGHLQTTLKGYERCHNAEEVIQKKQYDSERDLEHPTGSIFCSKGVGFAVPWDQVKNHMHVEAYLKTSVADISQDVPDEIVPLATESISLEEIDHLLSSTYNANQGKKAVWKHKKTASVAQYYETFNSPRTVRRPTSGEQYLLVDGYNIIFAWEDLNEVAQMDLEAARIKLLDLLCNYQALQKQKIIVVFDAYRVAGGKEKIETYHNIHVVYTGEAQTADQYIEKFAHRHQEKYQMTVATSDGLQQVIIRGAGCLLVSAREFQETVRKALAEMKADHLQSSVKERSKLEDALSDDTKAKLMETLK